MEEEKELTYGEKLVGLNFNPGNFPEVDRIKKHYAEIIDILNKQRENIKVDTILLDPPKTSELPRLLSIAITEAQSSQMWAVKAITWKD